MSGGQWEYKQYFLTEVIEDIDRLIEKNGVKKSPEEMRSERSWDSSLDWYEKYPEDSFHYKYSDEVIQEFKLASDVIKKAQVYIQRIDYLMSGDDGEESFLRRINQELSDIN